MREGWKNTLQMHKLKRFSQHACVYIYSQQLSSFRVSTLYFIDLTVATCHIQYTFLRKRTKHENTQKSPFSYGTKMAADRYKAHIHVACVAGGLRRFKKE